MTFREMNLAVFEGRPYPHVLFQPRVEPWLAWHKQFGNLSPRYRDMEIRDLFDDLGCSMRYVHYYTGQPGPIIGGWTDDVKVREHTDGDLTVRYLETPYGELRERHVKTIDDTWRQVEFPVKSPDDFDAMLWLLEHSWSRYDPELFKIGDEFIGDRGIPQFWVPKSPYQALAQSWSTMEDLVYAISDCPERVERVMTAIDESYDELYEQLIASGQVQILNFGENVHDQLFSPSWYETYLLPWYEKRVSQLRSAGIYTYMHLDGGFHSLLPKLRHMPFDAIEALTPKPQGDVDLIEMCDAMGDKILMDGIPAVLFLPMYSEDLLMEFVETLVDRLAPKLILGISDELPESAPEESMERVRRVADWCRKRSPAPA